MASPEDMAAAVADSLRARTGHSLDEWVRIVQQNSGLDPLNQLAVRRWLRDVHGIAQNSQWTIAFEVAGRAGWTMPTPQQFADQMYAGKKQPLRPLHDALVAAAEACGLEAHVEGRASYTPIVRARQFAAVGPGPRLTVRLGLRFREAPAGIEPAKGFAQATHWLHFGADVAPDEAVAQARDFLELAYAQNG
ncbi:MULTISPECIES: DUF5655 domain-containing protein [unclassified Luteococcus]|uniref:DUF5655 domain-containing protein n=1 Tax=unclassified Luteococcus TaxID=2639923 RepID=UPI00313CCAB8